jgi:hypothetical protein
MNKEDISEIEMTYNPNNSNNSNTELYISQKQLEVTLNKYFKPIKENDDEIDSKECSCMGPAPTIDALNDVVDTILMVTTLLLGFTAGTYMIFGHDDMIIIEKRWSDYCINSTDITLSAFNYRTWCEDDQPLSHEFFYRAFWSFILLGTSSILGFLIKVTIFFAQLNNEDLSGPHWRMWWYIFMWPLIICFTLAIAGLGLYMLLNAMIVRLIYPDLEYFMADAINGTTTSIWVTSQNIIWGATSFSIILAICHLIVSVKLICIKNTSKQGK